ncbi:MAG: DUF2339 domain-containing protein [Thermomonas sp.]
MEQLLVLLGLAVLAVPVLLIVCLVWLGGMRRRVSDLEVEVQRLRSSVQAAEAGPTPTAAQPARAAQPQSSQPAQPSQPLEPQEPTLAERMAQGRAPVSPVMPANAGTPEPARPAPVAASAPAPVTPPFPPSPRRVEPARPNPVEVLFRRIKAWFTVGNVPVKIGMLVSLVGVAALLRYASDQGWMRMPIELRLAGISAVALAALVFAWRKRESNRSFALALQGGAIGVLLLTVFAATKMYGLLPAGAAFAISIVLVAGLGVLAVLQDSRTLAVLGILAGFLAPIWLSNGGGNHAALFAYYAMLNTAIFAIAWVKSWRILNLLGFAFTWGIGIVWGVLDYEPAKYASTQPFLLLFFAFYLLLPILYARKRPARPNDRIDGCLLFGTPLIAFSLQAGLMHGDRMPLAFCALGLAAVYVVLARLLIHRERYAVLGQGHAILAVGFATLSVPLALSARATASVFALEGAGLVWLGLKQGRRLPRWTGTGLQFAAAVAFFIGTIAWRHDAVAVANPTFMGALLIALAGFASAWTHRDAGKSQAALAWYAWGLLWWCGNAIHEVSRFVEYVSRVDVLLAFAAITGWLAAEVHRRKPASALVLTTLASMAIAIPMAFAQTDVHEQPFAGDGWWAWLVFAVLGMRSLQCLRESENRFAVGAQFTWWLVWPTMASLLGAWIADRFGLAQGWGIMLLGLPWLVALAMAQLRWSWLAMPLGKRFDACRTSLTGTYVTILSIGWIWALFSAGKVAPLPWVPLLNPLDLAQLAALALLARWLWSPHANALLVRRRIAVLSLAGFALVTCITLRGVHHWGALPWDDGLLSTSLAQTSLTIVWSVLGVAGWIGGSRRGQRALWLAGAVLMGVVLAKLVLVDRQHLGNLLGIGSFIAFGLLCTLVGYFAPAPPRAHAEDEPAETTP